MKALAAGSEIDAWCTKCKLDLGHRIVAMVGTAPKRVICLTCGSTHNYRAPKSAKDKVVAKRTTKKSTTPRRNSAAARQQAEFDRIQEWEARIAGQVATAFKRYTIDASFEEGDLVQHKKFGEGYVVDVPEPNKVLVMFRDGERTLAQNLA